MGCEGCQTFASPGYFNVGVLDKAASQLEFVSRLNFQPPVFSEWHSMKPGV